MNQPPITFSASATGRVPVDGVHKMVEVNVANRFHIVIAIIVGRRVRRFETCRLDNRYIFNIILT
jgi:hypothetical protein